MKHFRKRLRKIQKRVGRKKAIELFITETQETCTEVRHEVLAAAGDRRFRGCRENLDDSWKQLELKKIEFELFIVEMEETGKKKLKKHSE